MKKTIKNLILHNRLLVKCIAFTIYILKGTDYQGTRQLLKTFVRTERQTDCRYIRRLTLDVFFSIFYYQISAGEYFWYQFEGKTDEERRTYIGSTEKDKLCAEIGDEKIRKILADKYMCYQFFKEFFGRDVVKISCREDKAAFEEFLSKHKEFIVKPIDQSGGAGIYRIAMEDMTDDKCFQRLLSGGPCIVEQCIDQAYELARFHPQSVNTIRIATFHNAGRVKVLFSIFRTGTKNTLVDNMAAGGVFASVNIADGIIQSDGYVKNGEIHQTHPDTGCVFHGFQIPRWQELLDTVSKAARKFPQYSYISWDFALTDSGWVMVEANSRGEFSIYQIFLGGIRELFMKEFREYKNKKGSGGIQNDT